MGRLKRRIQPSDITINIGEGAPVPVCPIPGERYPGIKVIDVIGKESIYVGASSMYKFMIGNVFCSWKEVKHDNTVTWLAFWNDLINQKDFKYVFLAASSSLKGQSDKEKYEKARRLKVRKSVL